VILGYQHHVSTNYQEAAANYRRAIELDSNFALAYGALATALQPFDPLGSMKAGIKSYELRDRLIVPNRLRAEFGYNNLVVGDQEKACAVAKEWAQTFLGITPPTSTSPSVSNCSGSRTALWPKFKRQCASCRARRVTCGRPN